MRRTIGTLEFAFFYEESVNWRGCFLFMDVFQPLPYLEGLLNRMVIKAIAASLFIRDVKENHEARERRMYLL